MKTAKLILFVSLFLMAQKGLSQTLEALSYNIRYANPADGVNSWEERKKDVVLFIKQQKAGVVGLQEVLKPQLDYLTQQLPDYAVVGKGRDDGKQAGEYSPILVDKKKYKVLESGTFWLSQTPDTPSKGWDAALNRICTWANIQDVQSLSIILVLNTHYDHVGRTAREQSSLLIMQKANELQKEKNILCLLMGDFNAEPEEPAIQILGQQLQNAAQGERDSLGLGTFNNFKPHELHLKQIDFFFFKGLKKSGFQVLRPIRTNQLQVSDHYPIRGNFLY